MVKRQPSKLFDIGPSPIDSSVVFYYFIIKDKMILVSFIIEWYSYLLNVIALILRLFFIVFLCVMIIAEVKNNAQEEVYDNLDPFGSLLWEKNYDFFPISLDDYGSYTCSLRPYYRLNTYDYVFYHRGSYFSEDEGGYLKCSLFYGYDFSNFILFYNYTLENFSGGEYARIMNEKIGYYNSLGIENGGYLGRRYKNLVSDLYIYGPRIRKCSFYTKSFSNIKFLSIKKSEKFNNLNFRKKSSKFNIFF